MKQDSLPISSLFSQENRLFQIQSPFGDSLLLDTFQGTERLSAPFRFDLHLLSERADLEPKDLIGQELQVFLTTEAGKRRFSGHVTRFARTGSDGGFAFYEATLEPWTAFMQLRTNCRIFHGATLPELLQKLFGEYHPVARYELHLTDGAYPPIPHRAQYDESDFDFVSRLLEDRGIYYYFRFDDQGHTLILTDDSRSSSPPMPTRSQIAFNTEPGAGGRDTIDRWGCAHRIVATSYAIKSFDFQNPQDRLAAGAATIQDLGGYPKMERYEHRGSFAYANYEAGERLARLRIQEEELRSLQYLGRSNCRFLTCGHSFELLDHFRPDTSIHDRLFLVTAVTHQGGNNYLDQTGKPPYRNNFTCVSLAARYRPPLAAPRPVMRPQTATVVGPAGEEIHCDPYGRVRVQFHWDREGTFTDASGCWARVMTPLAGSRFGLVALPRVGHEVMVDFLEGDPDRPIIIGQAVNEFHLPPWDLPANRTQSGILTRSTPDGTWDNANALRFEDRKGAEEVWLHAEKDQRIEVEHDESHRVDHDRSKAIGHDQTTRVGHDECIGIGHDRTETVGGDERVTVDGHQHLDVGQSQSISIGAFKNESVVLMSNELVGGAKTLTAGAAYTLTVGAAKNEAVGLGSFEEVGAEKVTQVGTEYHLQAGDRLELTVGQSSLVMTADGTITLKGVALEFTGARQVTIQGKVLDVNGAR